MPNIKGSGEWIHKSGTGTGAFYSQTGNINQNANGSGSESYNIVYFDASRVSSIYSNTTDRVIPAAIHIKFVIRY